MKNLFHSISAVLVMMFFSQPAHAQTDINADQTESMLKKDATIQLVDLRTPGEIKATGKIHGARAINFNAPDFESSILKLDKNKPVLLYCAAGGRSGQAATRLKTLGFKKVYDYTGGMNDWKARGKKTE
ncbi:MAG: rhodanese-like domain-containing protein [Saprospiraceae bacterium]|nr:rhodanese-like domain-containing protein [Saprospiraceae bacterium]